MYDELTVVDGCWMDGTYQQDFHGSDDVHGSSNSRSEVEEDSDGSPEFRTQRTRDHEIRSSTGHDAIRCYGAHRDSCRHRLRIHENNAKSACDWCNYLSFIYLSFTYLICRFALRARSHRKRPQCKFDAPPVEVCGYSIFATWPVAQDRYPYPIRTQNYYPIRPVPAGIPVPVTVKPSHAQSMFLLGW